MIVIYEYFKYTLNSLLATFFRLQINVAKFVTQGNYS